MKKSTILLLSALVFFLCTLTAFNFIMKAEFETGHYKDPYFEFVNKGFTDFNSVEIHGGNKVSVRIIQGDYQVRVHNRAQEYLKFKQLGSKLVVEVHEKEDGYRFPGNHAVLISCPTLTSLTTNARYTKSGKQETDVAAEYMWYKVLLNGFKQQSLAIRQDHATQIELEGNQLEKLTAVVGVTPGSNPRLTIDKTNQIQSASFSVNNKGSLNLSDVILPSVSYQFSDSAKVNLTGASLAGLSKK